MNKILNDYDKYVSPKCIAIQLEANSGYLEVTSKGFDSWGDDDEPIEF